jgi:serine/threonine protein kinase
MNRGTLTEFMNTPDYDAGRDLHRLVRLCQLQKAGADLAPQLVEAAAGLEYLHSQTVKHGDIKAVSGANAFESLVSTGLSPDKAFSQLNILIDAECHIQLCDFGLVIMGDATEGRMTTTPRGLGSGTWQSPERLSGERHRRSVEDDVYAFGCLGYYVSAGAVLSKGGSAANLI